MAAMAAQAAAHLLADGPLNQLFKDKATEQYTEKITFSAMVHFMGDVVLGSTYSLSATYEARREQLVASLSAVYEKLKNMSPHISAALVAHISARARSVMSSWKQPYASPLKGYRLRILDGNHQAATDRRLNVIRASSAGPLPSMALVIYDPVWDLPVAMIPSEDAYAQERAFSSEVLALAEPDDLWLADRNFCTTRLLIGFMQRSAKFLVREHANAPVEGRGPWKSLPARPDVEEQEAVLIDDEGRAWPVRRIRIRLSEPTKDGDREILLLSSVPASSATAAELAELYRTRWKLEKAFARMERFLNCELKSLGHPRAALFAFAVGLGAYSLVAVLQAALTEAHGEGTAEQLSWQKIIHETEKTSSDIRDMVGEKMAIGWGRAKPMQVAAALLLIARSVEIRKYYKVVKKKATKPAVKRARFKNRRHVSTYRLLIGKPQRYS